MQTVRRPLKILVVEDDGVLLQVLSRVLTHDGHDVLRATTVAEALRQADSAPGVALLDLSLPDGDGVELARTLHHRYPGLPLILMTAHSNRLREPSGLVGDFAHVFTKPMDLRQLQQVLNDVLPEEPMTQPTPIPKVEPVISHADLQRAFRRGCSTTAAITVMQAAHHRLGNDPTRLRRLHCAQLWSIVTQPEEENVARLC
jgi:CheY-like chemotaxis protein